MALHVALDFLTFHGSAALHIAGDALAAADTIAAVDGAVDIPATGDVVPALPDIAVDVIAFNISMTNNISINTRVAV